MESKIEKFRFLALAISLAISTGIFFVGAYWVKYIYDRVDRLRFEGAATSIQREVRVISELLMADLMGVDSVRLLAIADVDRTSQGLNSVNIALRVDGLQQHKFDSFALYSKQREQKLSLQSTAENFQMSWVDDRNLLMALTPDSSIFDKAVTKGSASALILLAGRPMLLAIRSVEVNAKLSGYMVAGKWFEVAALAARVGLPERSFDLFDVSGMSKVPDDVEAARASMKGESAFFGNLQRRGGGIGYLRFDDLQERPAFVLRFPWIESGNTGERGALTWLLLTALLIGGVIHVGSSAVMTWMTKQRRKNPGIAGLSVSEFRETVESFPGYAFAIDKYNQYLGVSRPLAGLLGKEPPEFVGKYFGSLASEDGLDPDRLRRDLQTSQAWPAISTVQLSVRGLAENSNLVGTCHWLQSKECMFFVMQDSRHLSAHDKPVNLHVVCEPQHPVPLRIAQ